MLAWILVILAATVDMELNIEQIVAEMRAKIASRPGAIEEEFSESDYLELYPDVRQAVVAGIYPSAYDHWTKVGRTEGRRPHKQVRADGAHRSGAGRKGDLVRGLGQGLRTTEDVRIRTIPAAFLDGLGEPAPLMNTLRGRVSYAFMRFMGKALWWYSYRLKQALESVVSTLNDDLREINKLSARLEALQQGLREVVAQQDDFRKALETIRRESMSRLDSLQNGLAEAAKSNRDTGAIHVPNLANRISALGLQTQQTRAELSVQERRLSFLIEEVRRSNRQSPEALSVQAPPDNGHTRLYVDFEAAFRGRREDIKQKQGIYIPMLREAGAGSPDRPVLDLGCGRGEWLELLKSEQMTGSGTDTDPCMVEICRGLGLNVGLADAFSALRDLPDNALGAVTAFHVVEHLPFENLLALVDESIRVLKPGGLLILETPNPGNVQVGTQYFYLDPTHVRPLPSPMLRFFVEARGMCRVDVLELHPYPESVRVPDDGSELAKRFNEYFYGARDYAVIARRP